MKRQILGLLLTCLLFPSCSKETGVPVPLSGEAKIQSLIDPEIQGADREVVAAHFRAIAEEYWDDMVLLQDGKVYSNRVSLLGTMVPIEIVGPGMGRIDGGEIFALPNAEPEESPTSKSKNLTLPFDWLESADLSLAYSNTIHTFRRTFRR
ncbi:hypothetical protein [Deinococcus sp.]|uniref:hypothetical protein n=1 Tax=Deinococcus sp. TaxID=47478 RepID=UPI0025F76C90|nr:hypothetical protein [Deinococcus sp.]